MTAPFDASDKLIYFIKPIGMDGPIKIGCSKSPIGRALALSHWSPFPLEVIVEAEGNFKLERHLHFIFRDHLKHSEWFHPCADLMAGIDRVKSGIPVEEAFSVKRRHRKKYGHTVVAYVRVAA